MARRKRNKETRERDKRMAEYYAARRERLATEVMIAIEKINGIRRPAV